MEYVALHTCSMSCMYAVDIFMGTYSSLVRDTSRHPETLDKHAREAVTTEWLKPARAPACPSQSKAQERKGTSQMIHLNF